MSIVSTLARGCTGPALPGHGLIRLSCPGKERDLDAAGRLVGGRSAILVEVPLGATVLDHAVGASGPAHIPLLGDLWTEAAVLAPPSSLSLFPLTWNSLCPDSMISVHGPIVSFIVMVPVSLIMEGQRVGQ
jgi:hypothetical protein